MFGFEKPRWHCMPEFGALLDALDGARQTLPEARSRFLRGHLPPGGRLMVRRETAHADEFQWARVESWEGSRHAVVRDIGRELAPGTAQDIALLVWKRALPPRPERNVTGSAVVLKRSPATDYIPDPRTACPRQQRGWAVTSPAGPRR